MALSRIDYESLLAAVRPCLDSADEREARLVRSRECAYFENVVGADPNAVLFPLAAVAVYDGGDLARRTSTGFGMLFGHDLA